MLPPPPAIYNSADELYHNAQTFANSQDYALVKKRTRKDRHGELKNITLRCDRGGVYNNSLGLTEETRKRHKGTRLIDCPFELYAARYSDSKWRLEVRNENHNHGHSENMSGHLIARRLTESQQKTVAAMTVAVISRDIHNTHEWLRQKKLAGRTPIQALIDKLKKGDFIYEYECDNAGCVTHLFFAHNDSVALTRQYSSVLIMDCTYKTNKFKMPLLNVVGITSFNTTFYSCFIFMKGEEMTDYQWALTHVSRLFDGISKPGVIVTDRELAFMKALEIILSDSANLLCLWHISKNILKNCKSQFSEEKENKENDEWQLFLAKWNDVVQSISEDEFNEKWQIFCSAYANKPRIIKYLEDTWILWKKKFVKAWTNKFFHLKTTVTSRVEGAHSALKASLQVSTGDLYRVQTAITLMVTNQKKEINSMVSSDCIYLPIFAHNNPLYANIKGKISIFALKKINEQYQKVTHATAKEPLLPCTGFYSTTMGLPCAHNIQQLDNNQGLILDNIHKHWWIQGHFSVPQSDENAFSHENALQSRLQNLQERYQEWPKFQQVAAHATLDKMINAPLMVLQNPNIVPTKGRPSGATNK
ncbi:unnamed protein product [Rhizophagus irregularis]|nr:unnamed protein product [Rhizophagus irregularis]CAB5366649.1 unnamed protein product [Rhizophagus irregularis]